MQEVTLWQIALRGDGDPDYGYEFNRLKYEAKKDWHIEDLDEDKIVAQVADKGYVEVVKENVPNWTTTVLEIVLRDYARRYTRAWFNVNKGQFVTLTPIRPLDDDNDFTNFGMDL